MPRLVLIIITLMLPLLLPSTGHGQGVTGGISILVVDPAGNPVADASVLISDASVGFSREVMTNADGNVSVRRLSPGDYSLQVNKAGYQSALIESLIVQIAKTDELTIPLKSEQIEEISVYATATSLMHVATGESGLNISMNEISMLPVARSIEAVALLAPGTIPGIASFGGDRTLVSFGGSSVAENVYYIDGLNVSNYRNGLGGSSVPFEFYKEFQIKTGGLSPEFGRTTGGVLNATTRRGTNEFEYGVVAYFEPEGLQATSPNTILDDGTYYDLNSEDSRSETTIDIYVGGPIIKDHLFFFVLYEPSEVKATYTRSNGSDRQVVEEIADDFWGGNLTWQINDRHKLSLTAFSDQREIVGDNYEYDPDGKSRGDLVGRSTDFRGGDSYIVNYLGNLGDSLDISLQYGNNKYDLTTRSTTDLECPPVVDFRDTSPNPFPGCWLFGFANADSDEREAYRFDIEFDIGNHSIRAGFDREENTSFSASTYSGTDVVADRVGGVFYRYETYDVGDTLVNGAIVPDANGDGSRVDVVRIRYLEVGGFYDTISQAWYIEDQWAISDTFTVSLGIRNEKFENKNGDGDAFIEVDDQWAPRIALQWLPGGSGTQAVTLNYGRYHLPIASNANVFMGAGVYDARRYFLSDGNFDPYTGAPVAIDVNGIPTTQELGSEIVTGDGSVPDTRSVLDKTIKPMYQDEWMLSYQFEINEDWDAGIRYIYRDLISTIEDVATIAGLEAIGADPSAIGFGQPCFYILSNPGTDVSTFCDVDGDGEIEETFFTAEQMGFPKAERTYEAIELTARGFIGEKWSIQGSYTWSKNLGNIEGRVKSDLGQDDAGFTEDFDIALTMDGAYGYLPNDRRHKFKLWGTYEATDRLLLSANLFVQSGRPRNAFGAQHPDGFVLYGDTYYLAQPDGSFEYSPRGSAGRTDTTSQLNLTAEYRPDWGEWADIRLRVDVFNVFNSDTVTEIGEHVERTDGVTPFGVYKAYQQPRYVRLGAAVRF